jgi:tungstate transport system substrate-binding protein
MRGDQPVLGERHLAILVTVQENGSLNAAAQRLGISYRDAWEKIRQAEVALGISLIVAQTGGRHGGGSRLTPAGEQLVARLRAFQREHEQATARAAAAYFDGSDSPAGSRHDSLRLATTTSVVDSGLLTALLTPFTRRMGIEVEVLPVGSGAALRLARTGRADVVLAHAPEAEQRALCAGILVNRRAVMRNEFVFAGPLEDPAGVRTARAASVVFQRIAAARFPFLSRGDSSGTHLRERALLNAAGIRCGSWYRSDRSGMAELLRHANEARAYVLTDRGTFGALGETLALDILYDGDPLLENRYSVLATNPRRHPSANYVAAMALIGWLTAPPAQELIAAYRVSGRVIARPDTDGDS